MTIMAIDLGKFKSMVCIYNQLTQEQMFETIATERGYVKTALMRHQPDLVVVEA